MISVTKTPFELRFPTVKKRLAANRAQIVTITPQDMEEQIDLTWAGAEGLSHQGEEELHPPA